MRKPKFGEVVNDLRMPSVEEAREKTAAFTLWSGYKDFPQGAVMRIFQPGVLDDDGVRRLLLQVGKELLGIHVHVLAPRRRQPGGEEEDHTARSMQRSGVASEAGRSAAGN